jgi:hypothetical protein
MARAIAEMEKQGYEVIEIRYDDLMPDGYGEA